MLRLERRGLLEVRIEFISIEIREFIDDFNETTCLIQYLFAVLFEEMIVSDTLQGLYRLHRVFGVLFFGEAVGQVGGRPAESFIDLES